jgi:dienelactone hydrolase
MESSRKLLCGFGALALALVSPGISRAEKLDLDRTTPVPANQPIPVLDFFRLDIFNHPGLNLTGTHIAALVAGNDDHLNLMIYDIKAKKGELTGGRGDSDVNQILWINADSYIFGINYQKMGAYVLSVGKIGRINEGYPLIQDVGCTVFRSPPNDRTHPLAVLSPHSQISGNYSEIVTLDTTVTSGKLLDLSGEGSLLDQELIDGAMEANVRHIVGRHPILETPNGFDVGNFADREGKELYETTSTNGVLTLHRLEGDKWVACPEDLDQMDVFGTGDNPGDLLVLGPRHEGQTRALEVLTAADGTSRGVLLQGPAYDFDGWLYRDPVSDKILGAVYDTAIPRVTWFDQGFADLQTKLEKLPNFNGQTVRIIGNSADGSGFLIQTYSDTHPSAYFFADLKAKTFIPIQNSRPWIDPSRMRPMGMIKYETRDEHKLDAYVIVPPGTSKQNPAPLVVLPPGSYSGYYSSRHRWEFNSEAQFFASRGYAVLLPNARASAGFTGMFPVQDEWDFRKMYEDVADATKAIVAKGFIDRSRVAILGTGFGGYISLADAAYEPSLYRCAIAVSPMAVDWAKYIKEEKYNQYSDSTYSRLVYKLGDPKADPAKFDALSPLAHAGQIQAAVFICSGEFDPTFVTNEAKELVSTVKSHGGHGDTISFLNEGGGVRHIQNKVELYSRIESFLAENMGAGAHSN